MNNRQPYELTIAEKLEQMPLPDLRDSIWMRIEGQLDMEMPPDNNGNEGPQKPNGWNLPGIGGILGTFIAMVAIVALLFKNNSNKTTNQPDISPNTIIKTETPILQGESPPGKDFPAISKKENINGNLQKPVPPQVNPAYTTSDPYLNFPMTLDSSSNAPFAMPNENKTVIIPEDMPPNKVVKQDTLLKKPRGVQGITNNDYRLVPTVDSVGKKKTN